MYPWRIKVSIVSKFTFERITSVVEQNVKVYKIHRESNAWHVRGKIQNF